MKSAGKKRGIVISNPISGVAFQQRQGRMDHVAKLFKILSGQICKLTVFSPGKTKSYRDGHRQGHEWNEEPDANVEDIKGIFS